MSAVARDLDLTASALQEWVNRARADRTKGKSGGLTTAERDELSRLRSQPGATPLPITRLRQRP